MTLFNFTACTGTNSVGNLKISANTTTESAWATSGPPITINSDSLSGMCYTWDGTTGSTGTPVLTITGTSQYISKACSNCNSNYSVYLSGCTGQGRWILGSDTTPFDKSGDYAVGNTFYLTSSTLNGCFTILDDGNASDAYLLQGSDNMIGPYSGGCSGCTSNYCDYQDVLLLIDESGSVSNANWDKIISGCTNIVDELKPSMDSGTVQVGVMRWSSCAQVNTLVGLSSDYDTVYNALTGATRLYNYGGTQPSNAISTAYDILTGSSVTQAEKNIVLITDGEITDFFDDDCNIGYSTTQLCNNIKAGTYSNGQIMKIITVGIGSSSNLDELATLSSGSEFSFESSNFDAFRDVTSILIPNSVCLEIPEVGTVDVWLGVDCCGDNENILIGVDDTISITQYTDGVIFSGGCYTFDSLSAGTIDYLAYSGDIISNICSFSGCPTCPNPTPTPTPTQTVTPTITPTQTVTPTYTPSPTQTPESTVTPTPTVTSTITPTPTVTSTITPTPAISNTTTPTPTMTPSATPPSVCYIGTTNGIYQYVDCCGVVRNGNSVGQQICFSSYHSTTGIVESTTLCTTECNQGDIQYTFISTNACDDPNGGIIEIFPSGGVQPYTIQNNIPGGLTPNEGVTGIGPFTYTGLTANTYTFTINDSSGGINQSINANVIIEGCLTVTGSSTNETCNGNNGTLTISGDSHSLPYNYRIYRDGGLILSGLTTSNPLSFNNLDSGDYYGFITDYGGSTGQTDTFTISSGTSVDFGFSVTGSSLCSNNMGAVSVTGETGIAPFTYLWTNGQTGSTITGLTSGTRSVTVTDASGCTKTRQVNVPQISELNITSIVTTQATCFNLNGSATITITGGTAPYLYSGDTGETSGYINDTSYTFTSLNGNHSVRILDSGFCDINSDFNVPSTAGFSNVSINSTDATCGTNGSISFSIEGVPTLVTYSITGSTGNTQSYQTTQQTHTFSNLASDTYQVKILSETGCEYTDTVTITDSNKFIVSTSVTDTSCGLFNGSVTLSVTSGTTQVSYPLDYIIRRVNDNQIVYQNIDSPFSSDTITNLAGTTYKAIVTDINGCTVEEYFTISASNGVLATINKTDCVNGDDGTANLVIFQGTPPFNITWSDNVNGQTGFTLNNLSGDTYYATIVDTNGCTLTVDTTINCQIENVDEYIVNNVCNQTMITTSGNKRSMYSMLNESYLDASQGDTNCVIDTAVFTMNFTLSSDTVSYSFSEDFYTGTTLTDVPSDNLWASTLDGVLSQITELQSYNINLFNNSYTLISNCDGDEDPLRNAYVQLELTIDVTVDCVTVVPVPPPSNTPTRTPNQTPTPTKSLTPTVTPTITNTPTYTPSTTVTATPTISEGTQTPTPTPGLSPTPTPTPTTAPTPKALLFILEQSNNVDFATYMYNNGSTFYGFGLDYAPTTDSDVTLFMDWPGWFDGTAPTVIETEVPQTTGGLDTYGNLKNEFNFVTTKVPQGTATDAWYIWLIPQSMLGGEDKRQTYIGYNINNSPSSFTSQPMTSSIYQYGGDYTGVNWVNDTYRMYTTHPGLAFSISTNDIRSIYFKGDTVE